MFGGFLATATQQTLKLIRNRLLDAQTGDTSRPDGAWVLGGQASLADDPATPGEGVEGAVLGIDRTLGRDLVIGVGIGQFRHGGVGRGAGDLGQSGGWTVAPYASYQIGGGVSLDAAVGFAQLGRSTPGAASRLPGEAERMSGGVSLNAMYGLDRFSLGGSLGWNYAEGGLSGDPETGTARLSGEVGYDAGIARTYFRAGYEYDTQMLGLTSGGAGREGFILGGGADFFVAPNVAAGVEAETTVGRGAQQEYSGSAKLRIEF